MNSRVLERRFRWVGCFLKIRAITLMLVCKSRQCLKRLVVGYGRRAVYIFVHRKVIADRLFD